MALLYFSGWKLQWEAPEDELHPILYFVATVFALTAGTVVFVAAIHAAFPLSSQNKGGVVCTRMYRPKYGKKWPRGSGISGCAIGATFKGRPLALCLGARRPRRRTDGTAGPMGIGGLAETRDSDRFR